MRRQRDCIVSVILATAAAAAPAWGQTVGSAAVPATSGAQGASGRLLVPFHVEQFQRRLAKPILCLAPPPLKTHPCVVPWHGLAFGHDR
jgi:hypothetical protein